jgi:hypothetical protein
MSKNCPSWCPFKNGYCRNHLGYSVPKAKEINKVSDKKKELDKEYTKVRKAFLADHPFCMAKLQGCKGKASQVHHMKGKVGSEDYLNKKFFLAVCLVCHEIIERNPAFARQNGFSVSRLNKSI